MACSTAMCCLQEYQLNLCMAHGVNLAAMCVLHYVNLGLRAKLIAR